jgi:hypothetical protein
MTVNIFATGMVVNKREAEANGKFVCNLKVQCTLGNYKNKQKTMYDIALWGKLGESLSPMIQPYDNDSKTLGTTIAFSGELVEEKIAEGKYINKKVNLLSIDLMQNLVGKDEQKESKASNKKEEKRDVVEEDDDLF